MIIFNRKSTQLPLRKQECIIYGNQHSSKRQQNQFCEYIATVVIKDAEKVRESLQANLMPAYQTAFRAKGAELLGKSLAISLIALLGNSSLTKSFFTRKFGGFGTV